MTKTNDTVFEPALATAGSYGRGGVTFPDHKEKMIWKYQLRWYASWRLFVGMLWFDRQTYSWSTRFRDVGAGQHRFLT